MREAVLCAVDVSDTETDNLVLSEASRIARIHDAQLDVVTVLPDYGTSLVGSFFDPEHHKKAVEEARSRLDAMIDKTLGADRNEKVRHLVLTGSAYEEILKAANEIGSDLIVVGAHKPDIKDYIMGPNASRIARHAKCSVLVVRG